MTTTRPTHPTHGVVNEPLLKIIVLFNDKIVGLNLYNLDDSHNESSSFGDF